MISLIFVPALAATVRSFCTEERWQRNSEACKEYFREINIIVALKYNDRVGLNRLFKGIVWKYAYLFSCLELDDQ